jgi:hypothetical protein
MAYDLGLDWMWRLPGVGPWDAAYISALAHLLEELTPEQMQEKKEAIPSEMGTFQRETQVFSVTAFIKDLLSASARSS